MSNEVTVMAAPERSPTQLFRALLDRRFIADGALRPVQNAGDRPLNLEVQFYRVISVVQRSPEDIRRLATTLCASLASVDNRQIVCVLRSDGRRVELYYGVVWTGVASRTHDYDQPLQRSLKASFPGLDINHLTRKESGELCRSLPGNGGRHVATLTGIPAFREGELSTVDEALEGLFDTPFTLVLMASPTSVDELDAFEANLSEAINALHQIERQSISQSMSESWSQSLANSWNATESTSQQYGVTETWGTQNSSSVSQQDQASHAASIVGRLAGTGLRILANSALGGVANCLPWEQLGQGMAGVLAPPKTTSRSTSTSQNTSSSKSFGSSTSRTHGESETETQGQSLSRQITVEAINREATTVRELLEAHLARVRRGRALGMWRTSVHLTAGNATDLKAVAGILCGAVTGHDSHLEPMLTIVHDEHEVAPAVGNCIERLQPPRQNRVPHPIIPGGEQLATLLTSEELGLWLRPPATDLPGIRARQPVRFSSNVSALDGEGERCLELGDLQVWNRPGLTKVRLSTRSLCSHAFVAGTTGSGKTTTIKRLLYGLQRLDEPVPFMVLEPAKEEYTDLVERLEADGQQPVRITIDDRGEALRFNPFRAPVGLPIGSHIDAVRILLRGCFQMQESLPQILERLVVSAYQDCGWTDFAEVVHAADPRPFPSFETMLGMELREPSGLARQVDRSGPRLVASRVRRVVEELGYEKRVADSLAAAMQVRLESFTLGHKRQVFCAEQESLDFQTLLGRPVFVSLSDIRDPDMRRFLLGSLFLRIYGIREAEARANPRGMHGDLRHLLVLEEAHHFVRAAGNGMNPGSEINRQSNQLVADAIAEMRAWGQGVLIADQAPAELDPAVIRNTNTKIIHRLLFESDCRLVGESMGLAAEEQVMLRRLDAGECIYMGPHALRPVACKVQPVRLVRRSVMFED